MKPGTGHWAQTPKGSRIAVTVQTLEASCRPSQNSKQEGGALGTLWLSRQECLQTHSAGLSLQESSRPGQITQEYKIFQVTQALLAAWSWFAQLKYIT